MEKENISDIKTLDTKTINENLQTITGLLDKGCLKGAYTLDEAFTARVSITNVAKIIELLIKKINDNKPGQEEIPRNIIQES